MPATLVKKQWRKKTFRVVGTLYFRSRYLGIPYWLHGSGASRGAVTITLPLGIVLAIAPTYTGPYAPGGIYHYETCDNAECPSYDDHMDAIHGNIGSHSPYSGPPNGPHCGADPWISGDSMAHWTILAEGFTPSPLTWRVQHDIDLDWDVNLRRPTPLIDCNPGTECLMNEEDIAVPFEVKLEFWTDLWALREQTDDAPLCEPSAGGTLDELYCKRWADRSASYLLDEQISFFETVHDDGTEGHGSNLEVYMKVVPNGMTHSITADVYMAADEQADNSIKIESSIVSGYYGLSDSVLRPYVEARLTRTFTDGETQFAVNEVYEHEHSPDYLGNPIYARFKVEMESLPDAGYMDFTHSGFQGYVPVADATDIAIFQQCAGSFTENYANEVTDGDGTSRSAVTMRLRQGVRPVYCPPYEDPPGTWWGAIWSWEEITRNGILYSPTFVDLNDSTRIVEWKGWWNLSSYAVGDLASPGGSWIIDCWYDPPPGHDWAPGLAEYFDLPEHPTGYVDPDDPRGYVREGMVNITNIASLNEPCYPELHDPPETLEFDLEEIPDHADCRVLLLPGIALDKLHWNAAQAHIGLAAGGTSGRIELTPGESTSFDATPTWDKSVGVTLSTDGGLRAVATEITDWCSKDFLLENKRLTGTRFAKIEWSAPAVAAQVKVSINDKWWILKASAAGAQTTIIDLCRPNCTGGGNVGPLQYRGTDGKLLYNSGSGNLMGECCCGDCDAPDQLQSIIPIELPKHLTTPPSVHAHDLGIGWGIGRVGVVRFDFLTVGTFIISNIKLYRKAVVDGGFCKIWLNPQSAYNNGRVETDPAVFLAGDAVVDGSITTCYLYRSGIIVVDGAVVGEVIMGGPQYLSTGSYPGWLWDWESISTFVRSYFPCVPYDSYETPTEGPYANGVLEITLLEPPNYAGIPCIPGCFAPQLDPVRGDLVDDQYLTATLQFDIAKYPCGFGSTIGGIRKMLRGIITGLAYSGRSPYTLQNVKVIEDGGGFWNELTNKLGWFASAKVRGTDDASVDIITGGAHPAVTVHQRNRQYTRAVVER